MGRRTTTVVLLGVVLTLLLSACGKQGCTKIEGVSSIRVQVPKPIQKIADTFRVELCQGDRCASTNFPASAPKGSTSVSQGVTLDDDAYTVDVTLLGKGWKPGTDSGLTILGYTAENREVVRHTEQFRFDGYYPNGKDCDPAPSVRYGTSLGGEDLVG
ncbi:MAG: hypothetical protein EON52_14735 [Actinomycetales bacterium]|nr:MAG: hypothetical protein EON52_14735 [Actinomycetales bacterium]